MSDEQTVESNDTLLDQAAPVLGEGEYYMADGIKGTGEIPEWYKSDKYNSVSEQAKAYTALESKFGGFTGAPKDGYALPEGITKEDGMAEELLSFASDSNMSQASFDRAFELLSAQSVATEDVNIERELSALGDNASGRIKSVEGFMKNNLDSETYEKVRYSVNSAATVELIESLIKATAPTKLPIDGGEAPEGLTWSAIETEMFRKDDNGNLMRSVNRDHEAKIQKMMKMYGG
jgi:hypothetical protein